MILKMQGKAVGTFKIKFQCQLCGVWFQFNKEIKQCLKFVTSEPLLPIVIQTPYMTQSAKSIL